MFQRFLLMGALCPVTLLADEAKVLLVSPPDLQKAWTGYAEMRAEQGTPMKVVTTDEIARNYAIGDLANSIRLCVRDHIDNCLLYTSPSPRDQRGSRMPSSA